MLEKKTSNMKEKINLLKLNAENCGDLIQEFGVKSTPHLVLYHKGKTIARMVGIENDEKMLVFIDKAKKLIK